MHDFVAKVERQNGEKLKHHRSDNGDEDGSTALGDSLRRRGIVVQKTEPYTPQQNSVAERTHSVLMDKARSMMH